MSSFIFVRHGKSQANLDGMVGEPDSPLSKEGAVQARKVGRELKREGITVVVASPYPRARETAEIIAKQLKIPAVHIIDDLRERGFGQLQGHLREHPPAWYYSVDGESDVEPKGVLIARCEAALIQIKKLVQTEKVVVVGHAISGFYLRQVASGKRFFEDFDPPTEMQNSKKIEVTIAEKIPMPHASREALWGLLAIIVGVICLVAAVWLMNQRAAVPATKGTQGSVPIQALDYTGDANLQGNRQTPQQPGASRSLQQQGQSAQSGGSAAGVLQPVTSGIPADWR